MFRFRMCCSNSENIFGFISNCFINCCLMFEKSNEEPIRRESWKCRIVKSHSEVKHSKAVLWINSLQNCFFISCCNRSQNFLSCTFWRINCLVNADISSSGILEFTSSSTSSLAFSFGCRSLSRIFFSLKSIYEKFIWSGEIWRASN